MRPSFVRHKLNCQNIISKSWKRKRDEQTKLSAIFLVLKIKDEANNNWISRWKDTLKRNSRKILLAEWKAGKEEKADVVA